MAADLVCFQLCFELPTLTQSYHMTASLCILKESAFNQLDKQVNFLGAGSLSYVVALTAPLNRLRFFTGDVLQSQIVQELTECRRVSRAGPLRRLAIERSVCSTLHLR